MLELLWLGGWTGRSSAAPGVLSFAAVMPLSGSYRKRQGVQRWGSCKTVAVVCLIATAVDAWFGSLFSSCLRVSATMKKRNPTTVRQRKHNVSLPGVTMMFQTLVHNYCCVHDLLLLWFPGCARKRPHANTPTTQCRIQNWLFLNPPHPSYSNALLRATSSHHLIEGHVADRNIANSCQHITGPHRTGTLRLAGAPVRRALEPSNTASGRPPACLPNRLCEVKCNQSSVGVREGDCRDAPRRRSSVCCVLASSSLGWRVCTLALRKPRESSFA